MLIYSYNLNLKQLSIANVHDKHSFHTYLKLQQSQEQSRQDANSWTV